jgi:hypothetical protein
MDELAFPVEHDMLLMFNSFFLKSMRMKQGVNVGVNIPL